MDDLLRFLKLLADPTRLNILGLLAIKPRSVDELAAILDVGKSTVSHHLAQIRETGLVTAETEGYYSIFSLRPEAFDAHTTRLNLDHLAEAVRAGESVRMDAFERKIIAQWVAEDRLQEIPGQRVHREIVLAWLASKFKPDRRYDEDQVWDRLREWCAFEVEETTALIRSLVDAGLLARVPDSRWYWRADFPAAGDLASFQPEELPIAATPDINRYTSRRASLRTRDMEGVYANLAAKPDTNRRLTLLRLALRIRPGMPHTRDEIERAIGLFTEEDPAAVRAEMLAAGLLETTGKGEYLRPAGSSREKP